MKIIESKVINGCTDPTPLLTRYFILRTPILNIYLHHFHRSDEDREMHDHPWHFFTIILKGGYTEDTPKGKFERKPGAFLFRSAKHIHRVELNGQDCWTLIFVTKKVREWGFWMKEGWLAWYKFHTLKGCGD